MCSDPWKDDLLRTRQYMKDRPDYRRINHHKQNWDGHNRKPESCYQTTSEQSILVHYSTNCEQCLTMVHKAGHKIGIHTGKYTECLAIAFLLFARQIDMVVENQFSTFVRSTDRPIDEQLGNLLADIKKKIISLVNRHHRFPKNY